jgi:maltose alpha-D-glucosyltransferase / alpha-amylase
MGDNIYLGDRNSVRTPMQWSSDRNGGFSRADPARLCAPPIQDPLYGFEVINVEAEERLPFSLLNWMKRLIAMRKQHRVFGRGSLEFIGCPNRKVLAYLRRDDRETILIVVNLSRSVQPALLDLRAQAGLLPIEMIGQTEFPRIGADAYFLSLGAYASYWFTLQQAPIAVTPRAEVAPDAAVVVTESLPALLVGVDWQNVLEGGTRIVLERQALVPFLRRQPWVPPSDQDLTRASFADWVTLRPGPTPAFLTIVQLDRANGEHEQYLVPLAFLSGDAAERILTSAPAAVLSRITGARKGVIVDGAQDEDTRARIATLIASKTELATARGHISGVALPGETAAGTDVLRVFRRIESPSHPAFELGRALRSNGFTRTTPWTGALEYRTPGAPAATIAATHAPIVHQGSGWDVTIDELRRYYERVVSRVGRSSSPPPSAAPNDETPPPFFAAVEQSYLTTAAALGKRTAEFHDALASTSGHAFVPETIDPGEVDALVSAMHQRVEQVLDTLDEKSVALDERARTLADHVLDHRESILAVIDEVAQLSDAGDRIRVHGDYHLGQVVRSEEDFVIAEVNGADGRTAAGSRTKQSPLKDVAGMMRSYSYAAYAALSAFTVHAPESYAALESWADTWQHWAADAFLRAYLGAPGSADRLPSGDARRGLLRAFLLDKAFDELGYELDCRPEWACIPLAGIQKLIEGPSW